MIAEFANYKSWIAWVPIVSLLAIPLLFRRVLVVSLAIVGAFVGFVVTSISPPLGRDAEQLGANIAVGLLAGAAFGALPGAVLDAQRRGAGRRDASVTVVGCALGLGLLGALVGGFAPGILAGQPPDLNVDVLLTIAVGGGFGWSVGAAIGWRAARSKPPPGRAQRWILAVAAASIAVFGAAIVASIQQRSFGPSIEDMTRLERHRLPLIAAIYCIDTTIAVLTLVAIAVRDRGSPVPAAASVETSPPRTA